MSSGVQFNAPAPPPIPSEWGSSSSNVSSGSASSAGSSPGSSPGPPKSPRSQSNRRKSAFGDTRASFSRSATLHDLSTGHKMKRKKTKRVSIIPEAVKLELAITQLEEIKRAKTVGQTWNSAAIFSVMAAVYTVSAVAYVSLDNEATACHYWQLYFGMRCLVLVPSSFLAWLWGRGSWSRRMPLPETMGFVLFSYLALIITIGFTTSLNQSCGRQIVINDSTVYIKLMSKITGTTFQIRRGECSVLVDTNDAASTSSHEEVVGSCRATLIDRRTWFEVNVAEFVGQLLLTLFAYTALFKPTYETSLRYTGVVLFMGFLGCWWQGFGFWQDRDNVLASGVGPAIFVFVCAAGVNVFNSSEMRKLEQSLVNASHELSETRYVEPSGLEVVYLKAEIVGAQALTLENPRVMDRAVGLARELFLSLSKTYFGYELTQDGELKQLMGTGKALTPEQTKKVQELMRSGTREDSEFLIKFHDVFDALSFALTFQNELMDLEWDPELSTSQTQQACTEGVSITPEEKESRTRAMTVGSFFRAKDTDTLNLTAFHGLRVKIGVHMGDSSEGLQGPTVKFTESLSSLSEGGMVLVSPPVAEKLAGALEQLSTKRTGGKTSTYHSFSGSGWSGWLSWLGAGGGSGGGGGVGDNVPRLVHMGSLLFQGSAVYHEACRDAKKAKATKAASAAAAASSSSSSSSSSADTATTSMASEAAGGGAGAGGAVEQDVEMASLTGGADGGGGGGDQDPVELWHVYNEPLFGRHIKWDDMELKLTGATQLAFGYYDAPVKRENRPEFAVVCFGDIDKAHELASEDHPTFTKALAEVNAAMTRLLVKHRGYNVPQREGHYMQTFNDPKDAVAYHIDLQRELLHSNWPQSYRSNPFTRPVHDVTGSGDLLYSGLQVSLGMSVGAISKALERARANYLGPTCNRSARVCGLAKKGQLLMCESEWRQPELALVRALYSAKVMLTDQTLKGIKGVHNIVNIETDPLTTRRSQVPRPKPGDNLRARTSHSQSAPSSVFSTFASSAGCGGDSAHAGGGGGGDAVAIKTMSGLTMQNADGYNNSNTTSIDDDNGDDGGAVAIKTMSGLTLQSMSRPSVASAEMFTSI